MKTHTPGPWYYCTDEECGHDGCADILALTPEQVIGSIHTSNGTPVIDAAWHNDSTAGLYVSEANARLIAAAPELLEALEHVLDRIRIISEWKGSLPCEDVLVEADTGSASAAIKKARGE